MQQWRREHLESKDWVFDLDYYKVIHLSIGTFVEMERMDLEYDLVVLISSPSKTSLWVVVPKSPSNRLVTECNRFLKESAG